MFVYRLGHGPLKAERRVRFPYALPSLIINDLRINKGVFDLNLQHFLTTLSPIFNVVTTVKIATFCAGKYQANTRTCTKNKTILLGPRLFGCLASFSKSKSFLGVFKPYCAPCLRVAPIILSLKITPHLPFQGL